MRIYEVAEEYSQYLHQFDSRVMLEHPETGQRKFVGIVLSLDTMNYFAPMSSPKPKHQRISADAPDVYKIGGGRYGVVNLNNMIPVPLDCLISVDPQNITDEKYRHLIRNQLRQLNRDEQRIRNKAQRLHKLICGPYGGGTLRSRCCDFSLLEEKYGEYETYMAKK